MFSINHALIISAPASKVFYALSTSEGLSAWWTSKVSALPKEGTIATFYFEENYRKEMKIELLNPLHIRWKCVGGTGEWLNTTINFEISEGISCELKNKFPDLTGQIIQNENGTICLVNFTHDGWKEKTLMLAECSYTWALFLKSLKMYCEVGAGTPWPNQHRITK